MPVNLLDQTSVHPEPGAPTPSQTVGPFFRFGLAWMDARDLVAPGSPGAVVLTGRVLDGAGLAAPDALVEIWQADGHGSLEAGRVTDGGWSGFGRSLTDAEGRYRFTTVLPGPVDDVQAPHIDVTVFARGLLQRLVTRVYLPDQPANDADPVLAGLDADRRRTLVATADPVAEGSFAESSSAGHSTSGSPEGAGGAGDPVLTFDIHLQGERETVFFVW